MRWSRKAIMNEERRKVDRELHGSVSPLNLKLAAFQAVVD
jgi:hypothetical protein